MQQKKLQIRISLGQNVTMRFNKSVTHSSKKKNIIQRKFPVQSPRRKTNWMTEALKLKIFCFLRKEIENLLPKMLSVKQI